MESLHTVKYCHIDIAAVQSENQISSGWFESLKRCSFRTGFTDIFVEKLGELELLKHPLLGLSFVTLFIHKQALWFC